MKQQGPRHFWRFVSLAALIIVSVVWLKPRLDKSNQFVFGRGRHGGGIRGEDLKAMTAEGDFSLLSGFWLGSIELADLRILYRITPQGTVYNYSLDQGGALIPAGTTSFDAETGKAVFWFPTIGGTYRATLDTSTDKNKLAGEWSQGGYHLPLNMHRYEPPTDPDDDIEKVPREFRFLAKKTTFGDASKMAGYWSGYTADDPDDDDLELVILQVEKITDSLVEPKLWQPEETPLPLPVRTLYLDDDGKVKVVINAMDESGGDVNAVFEGQLSDDGKKVTGKVFYDDQDYTPPLELVWSAKYPPEPGMVE